MRDLCAGSEVAQYTAAHLPAYVRALEAYKASRLGESLEHAFLGFDATLVEAPVVSKLKSLAGDHNEDVEEEEEDEEGRLESVIFRSSPALSEIVQNAMAARIICGSWT